MAYKLNKFQTELTDELKKSMPKEVWASLIDFIENVPFIGHLISEERGTINDRPWVLSADGVETNKKEIDITKPHFLENMDFFRERAIYFERHGVYTHLPKNNNPKSDYAAFWREEKRRWAEGLIREDGEWIPGYLYFYWNYCQISLVEKVLGTKKGIRKKAFPRVYLGDYLFFHYIDQAMNRGEHGKMLKCRGVGASFKLSIMSPCNMYVKPGSGNPNFHLASDKTFLQGDKGIWGKILDNLDFIGKHTPMPKLRLVDKKQSMEVQLGYEDEYGSRKGLLSSAFGISLKDNPNKARGIRGALIHYEEDGLFPNLEKAWNINREASEEDGVSYAFQFAGGCVCKGTKVYTNKGEYKNIEDLRKFDGVLGFDVFNSKNKKQTISWMQPPQDKECVRIETNFRILECSLDHPILIRKKKYKNTNEIIGTRRDYNKKYNKTYESIKYKTIAVYTKEWEEAKNLKKGDFLLVSEKIDIWGDLKLFDARLVGMLIGDGSYGMRRHYGKLEFKTPSFSNCDKELNKYVQDNYPHSVTLERPTKDGRVYKEISIRGLIKKLKEIGIAGQSKDKKRLPINYMNLNKKDASLLIAGLFDTDGCVQYYSKNRKSPSSITITQSSEELLIELKCLLEKFGIFSTITKRNPNIKEGRKDKNPWYLLTISSKKSMCNFYEEIPLLISYKKDKLKKIYECTQGSVLRVYNEFENIREERILNTTKIGKKPIYNLTAKENNTYLANSIITHNTGGVEGGSFEGSEKLFYNPEIYNIHSLSNVFDKSGKENQKCGFFWGAYLNRGESVTKENGEPDVIGSLIEILKERHKIAKSSSDHMALTQKCAESCITPQEAVMRTEGTFFPVVDLKDYLADIVPNLNQFTAGHLIGRLGVDGAGEISFMPDPNASVVREFPIRDNKNKVGAVEIFAPPQKQEGKVPQYRYIAGIDSYDRDESTTDSLGSIIIFDTWTEQIVAEYTGRPEFAVDFYETCYRLIRFYNAIANFENLNTGIYAYFKNKNASYLFCDVPDVLKSMDLVKGKGAGNSAKGTPPTKGINIWGRRLQAEWMKKVTASEDIEDNTPNLRKIRSIGYIKECIAWHEDINADRVSAMNMVMILWKDLERLINSSFEEDDYGGDMASSDFFSLNYPGSARYLKQFGYE